MTKEDKQLILKDLSARLPYNVKVLYSYKNKIMMRDLGLGTLHDFIFNNNIKLIPYLRPMSSMTEEETKELHNISICINSGESFSDGYIKRIDWLNAHHFDYRGLIEKGLAIKVIIENSPYNE